MQNVSRDVQVAINIASSLAEVKEGKFEDAANTTQNPAPFPQYADVYALRRATVRRQMYPRHQRGEPISIRKLERFVADWSRENGFVPAKP